MRLRNAARATLASLLWVSVASAQGATSVSTASAPSTSTKAAPAVSATTPAGGPAVGATPTTQSATPSVGAAAPTPAAPAGTAPAAPAGTAPTTAAPPATAMDGSTYAVRLRDLESRVDELKEQIRRSHTRLSLLSDTILSGGVGGARAEIHFKNEMSSAFRLTHALFVLDGTVQYNKSDDTGALAAQPEIPIFSGTIAPGDHTLQVLIQLRGHGYGVFSYLRGYKFEVKSSHAFTVTEGKTIDLESIAWEKGGVTTPLEQRPAVRYVEKLKTGLAGDSIPSPPTPAEAPAVSGSSSFSIGAGSK